jgi:hypothetical protein
MPYTLMSAATACGINRSTVLRAIKAGRISATKDEVTGAWLIEPAELHRLYPPVAVPDANAVAVPKDAPSDATTDALVAELRAQLAEMRQQRDAWQGIAERLALGTPKAPPAPADASIATPATPAAGPWRRAWRWMRATG